MEFTGASIGLALIVIAWILQLVHAWNGGKEIKKKFLIFYGLGIAWTMVNSFINDNQVIAFFNLVILALVCIVLIKTGALKENIKIARISRKKK